MGAPGDVDRLRSVLELLRENGLTAGRVVVGDIEVNVFPPHVASQAARPPIPAVQPGPPPSLDDLRLEYEAIQFGASEGPDFS